MSRNLLSVLVMKIFREYRAEFIATHLRNINDASLRSVELVPAIMLELRAIGAYDCINQAM